MEKHQEIINWIVKTHKRIKKILEINKDIVKHDDVIILKNSYDLALEVALINHQIISNQHECQCRIDDKMEEYRIGEILILYYLYKDVIDEFFKHSRLDDDYLPSVSYRIDLLERVLKNFVKICDYSLLIL